jgi:hypothetical protein
MLLFVTEIFAGAGELMQVNGRGNFVARVEFQHVEAVALQPDGLLATIFRELVFGNRVIAGQRQGVDGRELQGQLRIRTLTR